MMAFCGKVLKRPEENGDSRNKSICQFCGRRPHFLVMYSESCVSPDPEKVKSVVNTSAPSEAKFLLGVAQYVARFIQDYATITEPLR